MPKKLIITIIIFIFGCGRPDNKPKDPKGDRIEELKKKYSSMLAEAKSKFDRKTGWPAPKDCDGTLWAGLAVAGGVDSVKIELAEYAPGEIHRKPAPSCWAGEGNPQNGSKTTVSRDMIMGYLWALWAKRDLAAIKRLADYGEKHFWKMGEPFDDGRVIMSGNIIGLIGRMIKKLGGGDRTYRHIQPIFSKVDDYEFHLMLIGILLNAFVDEGLDVVYDVVQPVDVTDKQKDLLKWAAEIQPENATALAGWATYGDGEFNKVIDLLLEDEIKLPVYVRGHKNLAYVYWLFSARMVLARF